MSVISKSEELLKQYNRLLNFIEEIEKDDEYLLEDIKSIRNDLQLLESFKSSKKLYRIFKDNYDILLKACNEHGFCEVES